MPLPADEGRPRDDHRIVTDLSVPRALALGILAALAVTALTLSDWPARDYRHGDFFQYWAGAHALLEGADPYDLAWWSAFHEAAGSRALAGVPQPASGPTWTTAYPVWTLAAFLPLALLPFSLAAAIWLVTQMAAVGVGIAALGRAVLRTSPRRDGALLLGIALGSQPLWLLAGGGNVTGYLFCAFASGLALAFGGRPVGGGALLGVLLLKPQSLIVATLAVLWALGPRARERALMGAVSVGAVLVGVSFALRPEWWVEGWLRSTLALQGSTGSNASLWTLGRATGIPAVSLIAPLAAVAALVAWSLARQPPPLTLIAAAVPVSIAVAPHGWNYDQLHLLVTVAVLLETLASAPATRRWAGIVALAVVAGPLPWLLYVVAFARNTEDLSALVPVSFLALVILTDRLQAGATVASTRVSGASPD